MRARTCGQHGDGIGSVAVLGRVQHDQACRAGTGRKRQHQGFMPNVQITLNLWCKRLQMHVRAWIGCCCLHPW